MRSSLSDQSTLIIVSNRGPVTYDRVDGRRVERRGGGGLVTALRGLREQHDVDLDRERDDRRGPRRRRVEATGGRGRCSSRTTRTPTTTTTTSSRTRCSGSSSTRSGLRRSRPELDRAFHDAWQRRIRARQPDVRRRGRRRAGRATGRDGVLSRLPPLPRARGSSAPRGRTRDSRTSSTSRGRPTGRCCPRRCVAPCTRGCSRTTSSRFHTERWAANFRRSCEDVVGGTRGTKVTAPSALGRRRRSSSELQASDAVLARRARRCREPGEADRPRRSHRSVEEHRPRLPCVRALARRASRVAGRVRDARPARSLAPGDSRVRRVPWPNRARRARGQRPLRRR